MSCIIRMIELYLADELLSILRQPNPAHNKLRLGHPTTCSFLRSDLELTAVEELFSGAADPRDSNQVALGR